MANRPNEWIQWSPCGRYLLLYEYGSHCSAQIRVFEPERRKVIAKHSSSINWIPVQINNVFLISNSESLGILEKSLSETSVLAAESVTLDDRFYVVAVLCGLQSGNTSIELAIWKPKTHEKKKNFLWRMFSREKEKELQFVKSDDGIFKTLQPVDYEFALNNSNLKFKISPEVVYIWPVDVNCHPCDNTFSIVTPPPCENTF